MNRKTIKKPRSYLSFLLTLFMLVTFLITFIRCEKEEVKDTMPEDKPNVPQDNSDTIQYHKVGLSVDSCILIPIGQLTKTGNSVDISIDSNNINYDILDDGLGGFWAIIPYSTFINHLSELSIKITRRRADLFLFERTNDSTNAYLKSSELINWDNFDLTTVASQIYDEKATKTENALAIQKYVIDYLSFDNSYSNSFGIFTALQTYLNKKGVCINFSRLFIALCRAVDIPARSVSGVIFPRTNIGDDCLFHHQWCEFLDENNQWRSLDLTFTKDMDITSIQYTGFTYCAEETELFSDYYTEFMADLGKPFKTDNECLVIYCYLPTEHGAKFGFKLLHNFAPDSIVFEKTVMIEHKYNNIKIH
jgi:hypothetical protein